MVITNDVIAKLAQIKEWVDRNVCEFRNDESSPWRKWDKGWILDVDPTATHLFREAPRKVTRPMTVEEVMALGYFTLKVGNNYYHGIGHFTKESMRKNIEVYVREKAVYSTDGCKTWNLFTVTEEVAK